MGLLGIVSSYARGDIAGMASSAFGLARKAIKGDDVYQKNLRTKTSPADVIMWSGSKDSQTSYVYPPHVFPPSLSLCSLPLDSPFSASSAVAPGNAFDGGGACFGGFGDGHGDEDVLKRAREDVDEILLGLAVNYKRRSL